MNKHFTQQWDFIHSFIHSLIIHSFTHSLSHSFTHSLSHSFIHPSECMANKFIQTLTKHYGRAYAQSQSNQHNHAYSWGTNNSRIGSEGFRGSVICLDAINPARARVITRDSRQERCIRSFAPAFEHSVDSIRSLVRAPWRPSADRSLVWKSQRSQMKRSRTACKGNFHGVLEKKTLASQMLLANLGRSQSLSKQTKTSGEPRFIHSSIHSFPYFLSIVSLCLLINIHSCQSFTCNEECIDILKETKPIIREADVPSATETQNTWMDVSLMSSFVLNLIVNGKKKIISLLNIHELNA